ncbi:hypothetical protein QCA50_008201 [Cerrena zonata]|uniref:Uncharacterized protein n=1 Tax=Cerrena zonata TaxID=2478898 RepID=A0AAW0G5T1_9APHY
MNVDVVFSSITEHLRVYFTLNFPLLARCHHPTISHLCADAFHSFPLASWIPDASYLRPFCVHFASVLFPHCVDMRMTSSVPSVKFRTVVMRIGPPTCSMTSPTLVLGRRMLRLWPHNILFHSNPYVDDL